MKNLGFISLSLLFCLYFGNASAQQIRVNPTQLNLNEVSKPTNVEFQVINTSSSAMVIINIDSDCGCTKINYSKKPIAAGDSTAIKVTYSPRKGEEGLFYKTLKIHTSASSEPIKAIIRGSNK